MLQYQISFNEVPNPDASLANTRLPPAPYWIGLPICGPVKGGR